MLHNEFFMDKKEKMKLHLNSMIVEKSNRHTRNLSFSSVSSPYLRLNKTPSIAADFSTTITAPKRSRGNTISGISLFPRSNQSTIIPPLQDLKTILADTSPVKPKAHAGLSNLLNDMKSSGAGIRIRTVKSNLNKTSTSFFGSKINH